MSETKVQLASIMFNMTADNQFTKELKIHHRDMVPYAAYYVLSGKLQLIDKYGKVTELGPGEIVGIEEVWDHKPLPYEILTTPGTNILNLDKSLLGRLRKALFKPLV